MGHDVLCRQERQIKAMIAKLMVCEDFMQMARCEKSVYDDVEHKPSQNPGKVIKLFSVNARDQPV